MVRHSCALLVMSWCVRRKIDLNVAREITYSLKVIVKCLLWETSNQYQTLRKCHSQHSGRDRGKGLVPMNVHFLLEANGATKILKVDSSVYNSHICRLGSRDKCITSWLINKVIISMALYMKLRSMCWRQEGIGKPVLLHNHMRIQRLIWRKKQRTYSRFIYFKSCIILRILLTSVLLFHGLGPLIYYDFFLVLNRWIFWHYGIILLYWIGP